MKLINNILDNLYFYSLDVKEDMNMFKSNKRKNRNIKFKTNLISDIIFIFIIALIGAIVILVNNSVNKPFSLNPNKIKQIEIINFIQDDGAKKMIIDEREGIEKICYFLNAIRKNNNNHNEENVFNSSNNNISNQNIIFNVVYKRKSETFEINNDYLIKKGKTKYIGENNIETLWYTLNYNIVEITANEIKDLKIN